MALEVAFDEALLAFSNSSDNNGIELDISKMDYDDTFHTRFDNLPRNM